jgi:hypothetical protein
VTVEVGTDMYQANAVVITGEERDRLYAEQVAAMPTFGEYQEKTTRIIPVIDLERIGAAWPTRGKAPDQSVRGPTPPMSPKTPPARSTVVR